MTEFGCFHTKHTFIDLIFEHTGGIFFIHDFLHPWGAQSLIPVGSVLHTLLSLLQIHFFVILIISVLLVIVSQCLQK